MTKLTLGEADVLIVVDVQYDFLPGGALAVPDGDAVIDPINRLARAFRHVVLTQDWHPEGHASFASRHSGRQPFETTELSYGSQVLWPDHCIQGTPGAEISRDLSIPHAQLVIRKGHNPKIDSYSGFMEADRTTSTGLAGYLRERGFWRVFCAGLT
ncbi:MAG TPA: isochorismatase family protein, partial [Microvirga sp.]|nr:isochorismatase family protein [Microvirga sp.]